MHFLLFQATEPVTTAVTTALATEGKSINLIDLSMKGGPLMIPILLCSFIAIYVFIERYMAINKAAKISPDFMRNIRDYIMGGNLGAAEALCKTENSPMARMVEKGIRRIGKPLESISAAIENVGNLELLQLEKSLNTLATIAGLAPLIGFLGTVTGMIRAFFDISNSDNVTPNCDDVL
jgi:biopolymer transport protein ExbB